MQKEWLKLKQQFIVKIQSTTKILPEMAEHANNPSEIITNILNL
jgi:hypothetical protein